MVNASLIGTIASILSFIVFIPLGLMSWRNRYEFDFMARQSITMNIFTVLAAAFWFYYAYLIGSIFAGAPGFVTVPIALFNIFVIIRSKVVMNKRKQNEVIALRERSVREIFAA